MNKEDLIGAYHFIKYLKSKYPLMTAIFTFLDREYEDIDKELSGD